MKRAAELPGPEDGLRWSESYPGLVTPGCGITAGSFEVHRSTGISLRVGSEAFLCFDCGPDGGVYHPEAARQPDPDDDPDRPRADLAAVRAIAGRFDAAYNLFVVHEHHTFRAGRDGPRIEHAHTDGADAHRHPDTANAWFGHQGERHKKPIKKAVGEQRPYVALTDDERTFRVVIPYRYINPGSNGAVRVGRRVTAAERKALKPPPEWGRESWRESMEITVWAARYQAYGMDVLIRGGGAITMTALRMVNNFDLTPRYEIPGWTPTAFAGLP